VADEALALMAWQQSNQAPSSETESWNMANQYMQKISSILDNIIDIWTHPYKDGEPRYKELLRLERMLKVLISVYLDEEELKEAEENYIKFMVDFPIIDTGHSTILPLITEEKMFGFNEWVLRKLKVKGVLVPPRFDPDLAL
jgi:hypothetical protein